MIQLTFDISGQVLKRTDKNKIVGDTIGQFEAVFTFDDWWNDYTPTVQFTKHGKTYDCLLENNTCTIPYEVMEKGGVFYVSVFATEDVNRKTANSVAVTVKPSGYSADGEHGKKPTPTVYDQLLESYKELKLTVDENIVINGDGVVASPNADFAEVAMWNDGNPNNEDRIGYFVCFDVPTSGIIMRKANADDDAKGVTVANPSFAGNCTKDKFDENGKLLPQYEYVGVIGLIPVYDNGQCIVGGRCIPADGGLAAPSPNDKGYQVVERYSDDMVLISVEPNGDAIYRVQEQLNKMPQEILLKVKADLPNKEIYFEQDDRLVTFSLTQSSRTTESYYQFKIYNTEYTRNQTEILTQKSYWNYPLPIEAYCDNDDNRTNSKDELSGNYEITIVFNDGTELITVSAKDFEEMFVEFGATVEHIFTANIESDTSFSDGKTYLSLNFTVNYPDYDTRETIDSEFTAMFTSMFD